MPTLDNIIGDRQKKLEILKKEGIDSYPEKCQRTDSIENILNRFKELSENQTEIHLVGRIISQRQHGALIFIDLKDQTAKIQLLFKKDILAAKDFKIASDLLDLGDFIEATGVLFLTQAGEKTLQVNSFKILTKSLRPIPPRWYGLEDEEERYRRRYLDLLANEAVKNRFILRSKVIWTLRQFLEKENYLEVETPILQILYGGAKAKPFKTHLNALDLDLYLRIAPELYLKRLIIGGFEKIYEYAKNFRNEGMDREHNPEFSMIELYAAYQDRDYLFQFIENLMIYLLEQLKEVLPLKDGYLTTQGKKIKIQKPFKRLTFKDFFKKTAFIDIDHDDLNVLRKAAKKLEVECLSTDDRIKIIDNIFTKIRNQLIEPTFIIDHPLETSPLAKKNNFDPSKTLRLQFYLAGWELMNGFAELNDPLDQRQRFEEQQKRKKLGDEESHPLDEDFIEALEYGMPPTAGLGIGIDRLVAILTDAPNIKEVIFFPLMRPKNQ